MPTTETQLDRFATDKPPRPRRCIPLSLRIFVATMATLFFFSSIWFGLPIFRRYVAIRELKQLGGRLSFNETGPAWLRTRLGDSGMEIFDEVDWVDLRDTCFSDRHVKYLNVFTTVRGIDLEGTQITDSGLSQFTSFTHLDCLILNRASISDAALARIAGIKGLTRLHLNDTRVGDGGLKQISKLRNLKDLRANGTMITDASLAHLSGMPALRDLFFNRTQITDLGLRHLIDCEKLSMLFAYETQVTVEGAVQLSAASGRVTVFGPDRSSQNARLRELFPTVKILDSHSDRTEPRER